ncbi:MAG: hypothetical protein O8C64_15965 [Candidatus Methanoperedens sp.]|nr:hypothetical protein [Candidatus Methanoperedens sp.]MCZ7406657.1 hypothetical protein [Candidatus Methanoperedens sp.]
MRLSKNNLLIIGIVPIILALIIMYNFWIAIEKLYPLGMTTYLVFNQMVVIGAAVFLGGSVYWAILVYYIYLMQENEVFIQDNFTQLAGSGTAHLQNAKGLISQVLDDIKSTERLKPQQ